MEGIHMHRQVHIEIIHTTTLLNEYSIYNKKRFLKLSSVAPLECRGRKNGHFRMVQIV
jgi:hypothetical protein